MKPYILIVVAGDKKWRPSKATLQEIHRILGEDSAPLFASHNAFALTFLGAKADTFVAKVKGALGEPFQIFVSELGNDQSQWGLHHHHTWLDQLRRKDPWGKRAE